MSATITNADELERTAVAAVMEAYLHDKKTPVVLRALMLSVFSAHSAGRTYGSIAKKALAAAKKAGEAVEGDSLPGYSVENLSRYNVAGLILSLPGGEDTDPEAVRKAVNAAIEAAWKKDELVSAAAAQPTAAAALVAISGSSATQRAAEVAAAAAKAEKSKADKAERAAKEKEAIAKASAESLLKKVLTFLESAADKDQTVDSLALWAKVAGLADMAKAKGVAPAANVSNAA